VGLAPVVHRLEPLALFADELHVDLARGDLPRLSHLDDADRLVVEVDQDELVAGPSGLLFPGDPGGGRLLAPEDRVDELAPEFRPWVAELERSQVGQRTSASRRSLGSGPGSRSTWCSCQSVKASRPQSCRERSSFSATCRSISRSTASGRK
jgi:hypothetical protein